MQSTNQQNSSQGSFFALFLLFARFTNDRMTRRRLGMEALRPSRRFSAWLRWSCRGAQLRQKAWHGSPHLRQSQNRAARLPGSIDAWEQRACQNQLVVCTSDDL